MTKFNRVFISLYLGFMSVIIGLCLLIWVLQIHDSPKPINLFDYHFKDPEWKDPEPCSFQELKNDGWEEVTDFHASAKPYVAHGYKGWLVIEYEGGTAKIETTGHIFIKRHNDQ